MTSQEAVEIIKIAISEVEWHYPMNYAVAFETAIEALKKQTPKKVIFTDNGESLLCPKCGFDLMGSINEPDHDPYYCFECGQALDWSDGERKGNDR